MIKKLIDRLLGKGSANSTQAAGVRVEVPRDVHRIDPDLVDERAVKVVHTLQDAGYEAYIVGGAVRDLLLGKRPKDFDVATDATPEQVKAQFRRAFIIGRRFRLVHVVFGRGRDHEVIEVSTFRAAVDSSDSELVTGNEKTSKEELAGKAHATDASGRVLRDNVWGPQHEDAARRDFTVNAMYYDPSRQVVVDYHRGFEDARARVLRIIGDPETRYREDPVRIIRAVRFAAKHGFTIDPKTRAPMKRMSDLLLNVPQSRMFDEMIKLLQTGHSLASLEQLRKEGLHRGVFPLLDAVLADAHRHDGREKFIHLALADTDRRVGEDKPVAPSFLLACMLWHDVLDAWQKARKRGDAPVPALQQAIDDVFGRRIGDISGRGRLAADMREIWLMQPRFERRTAGTALSLIEQPRFRAAFDFLRLRATAGEIDASLAEWWESFSQADEDSRREMLEAARREDQTRRPRQRSAGERRAPAADADERSHPPGEDEESGAGEGAPSDGANPARKRRRRRRRSGGSRNGESAGAGGAGDSGGSGDA